MTKLPIYGFFAIFILFIVSSCNWIDPDINIDPNNPIDVAPSNLLPAAEAAMGFELGSDVGRYTSLFTQHHGGIDRQHAGFEVYSFTESDCGNSWTSIYADVMDDLYQIIEKSKPTTTDLTGSPYYAGIAKILMANMLGVTTDLWGDIPYSEAFQGASNRQPKYDTQEQVYASIKTLLTEAQTDLSAETSTFDPKDSDILLGGDLDLWKAVGNSLLARYELHLAKRDPASYARALTAISHGIASNDGNLTYSFGLDASAQNPWYQFMEQRGDIAIGKVLADLLNATNDPRTSAYSEDTPCVGWPAGNNNPDITPSNLGVYLNAPDAPVSFISYSESKFIEAEAAFQTGDKTTAASAYNDAVAASLEQVGVTDNAWLSTNATETDVTITLEKIMTQKYVALYGNSESWADWRRTGLPNILPAIGQTSIPRRWPYPTDERLYNAVNLPTSNVGLFNRVWWDVQ